MGSSVDTSTTSREAIEEFEALWSDLNNRMSIVPGKTTLRALRDAIQADYGVNLTDIQIIDEFETGEISDDLKQLINQLESFRVS
jgi:hypothetical protein